MDIKSIKQKGTKSIRLQKSQLIDKVLFRFSLNAAFQRNRIYKKGAKRVVEKEFKEFLENSLEKWLISTNLKENYGNAHHYRAIASLSKKVTNKYGNILNRNSFNIGTAQKLINVYWKANWIFKKNVKEPIHCPFDGIIIKRLSGKAKDIKWTKMKKIEEYKLLVNEAKKKSNGGSIARWELVEYNEFGLMV